MLKEVAKYPAYVVIHNSFESMIRFWAQRVIPPILIDTFRDITRRYRNPSKFSEEIELKRLSEMPTMQPTITNILGWPFHVIDGKSFVHLYKIYFKKQLYKFNAVDDHPFIIDCGANIGISVAWWKTIYPKAQVLAFEADPDIFEILKKNCSCLPGVKLVNAAVWNKEGEILFYAKGGEGGHVAKLSEHKCLDLCRVVPTARLQPFLTKQCELIKMDIEGAEVEVIRDCANTLENVARIFVEYHSFAHRKQFLGETISCLENAGFRLHVHVELPSPRPFDELLVLNEKDLRLDLFCFREHPKLKSCS